MIFNLIAEGSQNGLTTGALVAIILCGAIVLGLAIWGIVLSARGKAMKFEQSQKNSKHEKEEEEDFSNLSNEEKDLIRKHRRKK